LLEKRFSRTDLSLKQKTEPSFDQRQAGLQYTPDRHRFSIPYTYFFR
jgi:hypothetical protein